MCHGHVDLKTFEREVQHRLRASVPRPTTWDETAVGADDVAVPPSRTGRLPGFVARLRTILNRRLRVN